MKPLKLTMSAFGSYGTETVIDFSAADHGLFLITGDTGSGKTTIFDGITFAIYGETSGGKRDGKMMRSQYASPSDETFVELTFSYRGETYTVRRIPEYMREKKRGSGLVKAPATVELTMPDGTAFRGKMKETDKKLCEIMGIDREQFTQIAMIAQGEFLRLLHAKSEDRKKIFSTIFHTGLYRRVEEELGEKRKDLKEKIGGFGERLRAYVRGIQMPDLWNLEELNQPEIQELLSLWEHLSQEETPDLHEVQKFLQFLMPLEQNAWKEQDALLAETERKYHQFLEQRGRAKRENDVLDSYTQLNRKKIQLEEQEDFYRKEKECFERAERAAQVTLFWDKEKRAESRKKDAETALHVANQRFENARGHILQLAGAILEPSDCEKLGHILEEKDQQDFVTWITEWRAEEKALLAAAEKKETLNVRARKIKNFEENCQKKAERLEENMVRMADAREYYGRVQEAFFREQAGILAKERLIPGKPCPVCGSLEHPAPAVLSDHAVTEADVRQAQKNWESRRAECEQISLELRGDRARIEEAKRQILQEQREIPGNLEERQEQLRALLGAAGLLLQEKENQKKKAQELENWIQAAKEAHVDYETVRSQAGFSSEEAYLEAANLWRDRLELERAKKKNEQFFKEMQELRAASQALEEQAAGIEYTDLSKFDGILEQWKEKRDAQAAKKEQISRAWSNHRRLADTISREEKEYQVLVDEFLLYDSLWQVAGGKTKGQVRLDFETYVQRMYFEKILAAANQRFLTFTDGKMKLKSRPLDEMGLVGAAGLEINVYVMATGKERDVKTLSGGESFLASLALALGLSDVVQSQAGSVRLESMFVDEGFGALDDETREQAMRVLHDLAGDHRMVGIISHVNALKDSIEKQLVVKRGLHGSTVNWKGIES